MKFNYEISNSKEYTAATSNSFSCSVRKMNTNKEISNKFTDNEATKKENWVYSVAQIVYFSK